MVSLKSFFLQKAPIAPQDPNQYPPKKVKDKNRFLLCQPYNICGDVITNDIIDPSYPDRIENAPYMTYKQSSHKDGSEIPLSHLAFMIRSSENTTGPDISRKVPEVLLKKEIVIEIDPIGSTTHCSMPQCTTIVEEDEDEDEDEDENIKLLS